MSRRLVMLVFAAALAGACTTPTIPIPPPQPGSMTFALDTTAGTATFAYAPMMEYGGAIVYVLDESTSRGVITQANIDGSVSTTEPFLANDGDYVTVQFKVGDDLASLCVILHGRPLTANDKCP